MDANRIGLWGGSYGGYLTALGLARASDLFAAGVDLHGVHDWNLEIRHLDARVRSAEATGGGAVGVGIVADVVRQDVALARAADSGR